MAPEPDRPPLDELRTHLRATQEAAERLAGNVPPQGWAAADDRDAMAEDVRALVALLHTLRDVLPPDLWEQARELIRRLMLLLRAVLDLVVERLGAPAAGDPGASASGGLQDIPIT
jgi:hypothetical protein